MLTILAPQLLFLLHGPASVIIRYLDIVGVAVPPHKAHSVPIVDPNTVLAVPIIVQMFEPIAGRNPQIFEAYGSVDSSQFPLGYGSQIRWRHSLAPARAPELFRILVRKRLDHLSLV
jgi:hypothetical protein